MPVVTNDDIILQLRKIMIWRVENKLPADAKYRVGVNHYTREEFLVVLRNDDSTILGQFIQYLAEEGFEAFKMGVNCNGFQIMP